MARALILAEACRAVRLNADGSIAGDGERAFERGHMQIAGTSPRARNA